MEPDEDVLSHYGIKGMKWGVRRKRGADGRVKQSEDYAESRELLKKGVKGLSNNELRKVNQRLQLEKSFAELNSNNSSFKKGKTKVKEILEVVGMVNQAVAVANSPAAKTAKSAVVKSAKAGAAAGRARAGG